MLVVLYTHLQLAIFTPLCASLCVTVAVTVAPVFALVAPNVIVALLGAVPSAILT